MFGFTVIKKGFQYHFLWAYQWKANIKIVSQISDDYGRDLPDFGGQQ